MPKEKLTKELVREAVTLVQSGASNKDVIAYLGVNQATFYRWLNTPKTENQRELCKLLKKAETERKVWHLQRIHKAAEEGNAAALAALEKQRQQAAEAMTAAAKAHEAAWCAELVQRALGGEAAQ